MHIIINAICLNGYPQSTANCALWVLFVVQLYSVGTIVHSTHRVQFLYCQVTTYNCTPVPVCILWTQSGTRYNCMHNKKRSPFCRRGTTPGRYLPVLCWPHRYMYAYPDMHTQVGMHMHAIVPTDIKSATLVCIPGTGTPGYRYPGYRYPGTLCIQLYSVPTR